MLYVEGPTDLDILRTIATVLEHSAARVLQAPYVHYLHTNVPSVAFEHFRSVREAVADLSGVLVLDRLESAPEAMAGLGSHCWRRREIENYLCTEELFVRFARGAEDWDLFSDYESGRRETAMREAIQSIADSLVNLDRPHPWSPDCKVSDDFLEPLFKSYYKRLGLPNVMQKTNFHILARFLVREEIDPEVVRVLDLINATAMDAWARTESVDA